MILGKPPQTKGLVWTLKGARWEARWRARKDIVRLGYPTKGAVLWNGPRPNDAEMVRIKEQSARLQNEMIAWSIAPDGANLRLGYIYFVTDEAAVKIGYSLDVLRRLYDLQQSHYLPLRVMAKFVGTLEDEAALHAHFRDLLIQREWFRLSPRIDDMIARLEGSRNRLHSRQATIRDIHLELL